MMHPHCALTVTLLVFNEITPKENNKWVRL